MSKSMYEELVRQFINDKQFPKEFTAQDVLDWTMGRRNCSSTYDSTLAGIQDWLSHNIEKVEYVIGTVVERYRKVKRGNRNVYFKANDQNNAQVDTITDIILNEFIAYRRTIKFDDFISKVFPPNYDPEKAEAEILEILAKFPSYRITEICCDKVAYHEGSAAPLNDSTRQFFVLATMLRALWPGIKAHYAAIGITNPVYDEELDMIVQCE